MARTAGPAGTTTEERVTNQAAQDLRDIGDEELVTRLREAKEELFNLRFQVVTGQLDNNARLRTVRRGIARIYTVMRERELGISYVSAPPNAPLPTTTAEPTVPATVPGATTTSEDQQ